MGADPFTLGALLFAGIGASAQVASAQDAKSDARKQRQVQEKQQRLQQRLSEAKARRTARIRRAQIEVTAGAEGVGGSIVQAPVTGIESAATTQAQLTQQQGELQREQFGIAEAQTVNEANAAIAGALGTFAATAFTPNEAGESLAERAFR